MSTFSNCRRIGATLAGAGVLAIGIAGPASAHHCFKDAWQPAARAQLEQGKTAWVSMTDFTAFAITAFLGGSEECAAHADEFVEEWMTFRGLEEEPFIHSRATVGGGAADRVGREPKPMSYLDDDDFAFLDGLVAAEPDCDV